MQRILSQFYATPWAILPSKLVEIRLFLSDYAHSINAGVKPLDTERSEFEAKKDLIEAGRPSNVAVIQVFGVIANRMNMMSDFSGGTSTELLSKQISSAINSNSVSKIVLDIDSPGGSVHGVEELTNVIRAGREEKPIVAVANSLAASAAYWIGSMATEFYMAPGADVGSIGVISAHEDRSKQTADDGKVVTIVSAGKFKSEGNPFEELSTEAVEALQARVDEYYETFVNSVAEGRGVGADKVMNGFGQGRVVGSKEAVSEGMVDGVRTLSQVINAVSDNPKIRRNRMKMQRNLELASA